MSSEAPAAFKNYFSAVSTNYAAYRPDTPGELVAWVASLLPAARRNLVVDCGCGSGQASVPLAAHFAAVVGVDPSQAQVSQARPHERVRYVVARAERTGLEDSCADAVVCAQAMHWFNFDEFYPEVLRLAKDGAVFAAWTYYLPCVVGNEAATRAVLGFVEEMAPYWPPERKWVDEKYRTIPFPFKDEVEAPEFFLSLQLDMDHLAGSISSWSCIGEYKRKNSGADPIPRLISALEPVWGPTRDQKLCVRWPFYLRVARKKHFLISKTQKTKTSDVKLHSSELLHSPGHVAVAELGADFSRNNDQLRQALKELQLPSASVRAVQETDTVAIKQLLLQIQVQLLTGRQITPSFALPPTTKLDSIVPMQHLELAIPSQRPASTSSVPHREQPHTNHATSHTRQPSLVRPLRNMSSAAVEVLDPAQSQMEITLSTYKIFRHKKFQLVIKIAVPLMQQLLLSCDDILIAGLNAKCCRETSNEEIDSCQMCGPGRKLVTIGVSAQSPFQPEQTVVGDTAMNVFVFDDCKSNCSSSRDHLHTSLSMVVELHPGTCLRTQSFVLQARAVQSLCKKKKKSDGSYATGLGKRKKATPENSPPSIQLSNPKPPKLGRCSTTNPTYYKL
ncbi:class I SAM-dependent methyltransferase [Pelomyxa schiedti]|nr:class I SAM-dependent methyltransferase [Pelomyxa schiedti]